MSAIHHPSPLYSVSRPNQLPLNAGVSHLASGVSESTIDALLRSAPNNAREPKQPDTSKAAPAIIATPQRTLSELAPQITKGLVERTLRRPDCKHSEDIVNNLNTLLTSENIDSLLNSPDSKSNAKTLGQIEMQLNKDAVSSVVTPFEQEMIEAYRRQVDAELFQLAAEPLSSRFNKIRSYANATSDNLLGVEHLLAKQGTRTTLLCSIAERIKQKLGALKFAENNYQNSPRALDPDVDTSRTQCPSQFHVYRYDRLNESSITTPSEIHNFAQGHDKLDVTGLRHQLDKPLRWVNRLSGESAEVLLRYSPEMQTSVLLIAGNKGEPVLVAKIFGEVRESDVLT